MVLLRFTLDTSALQFHRLRREGGGFVLIVFDQFSNTRWDSRYLGYDNLMYLNAETRGCVDGEFQCEASGLCIPESKLCDLYPDCSDGSDELNCSEFCVCLRIPTLDKIFTSLIFPSKIHVPCCTWKHLLQPQQLSQRSSTNITNCSHTPGEPPSQSMFVKM